MGITQSCCSFYCCGCNGRASVSNINSSAWANEENAKDSGNRMLNVPSPSTSLTAKPTIGRSEYGRVKVALPKGKGLMDWVRLTTGKVLAKKRLQHVDHEELSKHCTHDDCWILIFGKVYDVTEYLEFHPGGIPELLRAAGTDGTDLFNQYHAWVNYENMLKSCYVGQFSGDSTKCILVKKYGPPTSDNVSTKDTENVELRSKIMIFTAADRLVLCCRDWKGIQPSDVIFESKKNSLRLLVRRAGDKPVQIDWAGIPTPICQCDVEISTDVDMIRIEFQLITISLKSLESPGLYKITRNPPASYHECKVVSVRKLTHDTHLYTLRLPSRLYMPITSTYHVSWVIRKGAARLYRDYTPVGGPTPGQLQFMIKIYADGICTPALRSLKEGDTVEVSDLIGDWDLMEWTEASTHLVVIAAGSGWTPMVSLIDDKLRANETSEGSRPVTVIYFNKTEEDIVDDEWMPFRWTDERLKATHVLTRPDELWKGKKGRISLELMRELLEADTSEKKEQRLAVCGPDGFIQSAVGILTDMGYSSDRVHVFQG